MRYSSSEKYEIIRLVEESSLPVRQTLKRLDIHKSTFYNWLKRYYVHGVDGLEDRKPTPTMAWNKNSAGSSRYDHRTGTGQAGALTA